MDTRDFLVPDNYADFHCKCGQCRHTCCDGWAVTFQREDYGTYQERPATAAVSLCAEYAVLRGTAVLYHQLHPDETALVDAIAALFRVLEHSAFGWNAAVVLEREGKAGEDVIGQIVGI